MHIAVNLAYLCAHNIVVMDSNFNADLQHTLETCSQHFRDRPAYRNYGGYDPETCQSGIWHPVSAYRPARVSPIIKADCDLVTDTSRGTTLEDNGAKVSTVEHVLAALVGMGVDNCLIEINGPETPIMDGSSQPFIDIIR